MEYYGYGLRFGSSGQRAPHLRRETWLLLHVCMSCDASDPLQSQKGPSQWEQKSLAITYCRTGHLCGTFKCCQVVPKCQRHWSQCTLLFWEATTSHPTQAGHSKVRNALPRTYSSCLRSVTSTSKHCLKSFTSYLQSRYPYPSYHQALNSPSVPTASLNSTMQPQRCCKLQVKSCYCHQANSQTA